MSETRLCPFFFFYGTVVCHCVLSMFKVHLPLDQGCAGAGERRTDRSFGRRHAAPYDSQILPLDLMTDAHAGEDAGADQVLCDDGETGSVTVKAVRTAEDERHALLAEVVHKCICQGVTVVVKGRMDRHAGRLIDDEDVPVLIDDIQGQFYRRDIRRGLVFPGYVR